MDENPWILASRGELPEEELDPELRAWQSVEPPFGLMIKHPLVFAPVHHPRLNAAVNWSLREKKRMRRTYLEREDWRGYVFCHERPYRLDAFDDIHAYMPDHLYWGLLGDIWTDSENIWQRQDHWQRLLGAPRPGRAHLMDESEQRALAAMDPTIVVHRGYAVTGREHGLSWTRDRATASWFAGRLAHDGQTPRVASGVVARAAVIAHFTGRGEDELVILPGAVQEMTIAAA